LKPVTVSFGDIQTHISAVSTLPAGPLCRIEDLEQALYRASEELAVAKKEKKASDDLCAKLREDLGIKREVSF
jgi:hypothetical protein